ncbi:WASH complex subunit 3-like isoform X1 [Cydia pomonella]|uniref:WASH complex subunit 3-like isoform X1 n=1 Tax=Cydia pomonella TaxID=82600 RepID=UPI002ADE2E46|nr:WASH complex subunit 3-like isoform X1 [Cydia pomonella]
MFLFRSIVVILKLLLCIIICRIYLSDDTPAPPGPSGFRVPRPPPSESSYVPSEQDSLDSFRISFTPINFFGENTSKAGPSGFKAPRPPPTETIAAPPSSRRASLESIDLFLAVKEEVENSGRPCGMVEVFAPSYPPSPVPSNGSRDPPPPNPDVYEFDELEGSRPPSGLRRRNQQTPDPPAQSPESIQYMDICPTSSQLAKINTKKKKLGTYLVSAWYLRTIYIRSGRI